MRRAIRASRWTWDTPIRLTHGVRLTAPHASIYIPSHYLRDTADFLHGAADDLDAIERGETVDYQAAGHGLNKTITKENS